jgi:allantoicase
MQHTSQIPDFARNAINLASGGLGARGVYVTDEFFAPVERMLQDKHPIFIEDKYDDNGKWMDGWESRRRRGGGHDYAIIRLAVPGRIIGFDVNTAFFTGNYPPACSIEACHSDHDPTDDEDVGWVEILGESKLGADAHHYLECHSEKVWTHIRIHIHPDGGIARLRVYGQPFLDLAAVKGKRIDLASALNGGRVLAYSDAHYGAFYRILAPGRGSDMGDGWETRRRRGPGHDWIIIALGARGMVDDIRVDTGHYKGNYPDSCSILAADLGADRVGDDLDEEEIVSAAGWPALLPPQKLSADKEHDFHHDRINEAGPVTHIALNIFPDGGISRLRIFGKVAL